MKKIFGLIMVVGYASLISAQYMIVGKDSISLDEFKKEYQYGLENSGIENTITNSQNFYLFQQFAKEKKADTLTSFKEKMSQKESELRSKYFFPASVMDPIVSQYVKDNQTERELQILIVEKTADDKTDYQQVYNDVKSGKITMEEAISKYSKGNPKPVYLKPGSIDQNMFAEIKSLPNNTYTKLYNTPSYIGFAKVLNTRPSLGYMIFGTISFPKDEKSPALIENIFKALKGGTSFQEVAKLYGSNDHEKNNGGVIMGSPTLPNEVYALFKGKKEGYYTPEPLLYNDQYFIFNIYSVEPYVLNEKTKAFFQREMSNSLYSEVVQDKMVEYLKKDPSYKEYPALQNIKKSYQNFSAAKDSDLLYEFKNEKVTAGTLKKLMGDKSSEAEKLSAAAWSDVINDVNALDVLRIYNQHFTELKNIKQELNAFKKSLYSDFIFSKYLTDEIKNHPEWQTEYYNKNKSKYLLGERADGRVAIISDQNLVKEISKEIKDPKNWEALKRKYSVVKNAAQKLAVNFEDGEMSKDAEVFTKYKVPFKTGIHQTEMGAASLVIAIDKILPPGQMSQLEASEAIKDAVTEQRLNQIIAEQKAKTQIIVQPEFLKGLEKNFKK